MEKISIKDAWKLNGNSGKMIHLSDTDSREKAIVLNRFGEKYECFFDSVGIHYISGNEAGDAHWNLENSAQ